MRTGPGGATPVERRSLVVGVLLVVALAVSGCSAGSGSSAAP
jgi:hypothetical protein